MSTHDRDGGQREMEQQLVGLFGGRLAVVARHRDVDVVGDDPALDRLQARRSSSSATTTALAPLRLAMAMRDGGRRSSSPAAVAGHGPGAMVGLGGADDHVGDVLDIDRPAVARGEQQQADVGNALQGLAGDDRHGSCRSARKAPTRKERLALASLSTSWLRVMP